MRVIKSTEVVKFVYLQWILSFIRSTDFTQPIHTPQASLRSLYAHKHAKNKMKAHGCMRCEETIQMRTTSLFLSRSLDYLPRRHSKQISFQFTPRLVTGPAGKTRARDANSFQHNIFGTHLPFAGEILAFRLHTRLGTRHTPNQSVESFSVAFVSFLPWKDSSAIGKAKVIYFDGNLKFRKGQTQKKKIRFFPHILDCIYVRAA